ncbi:hypothetical protein [Streptomyces californicus]|uniref:hypothetical protein n=1 Tax=Streptomyces californicus TaxID=67351 RepID=UPI0037208F04
MKSRNEDSTKASHSVLVHQPHDPAKPSHPQPTTAPHSSTTAPGVKSRRFKA